MDLCSTRIEAKRRLACCVRIITHRGREGRPYPHKAKRGDSASDYLGLGAEARMNKPSILNAHNWTWRALPSQITSELAEEICTLTKQYER